MDIKRNKIIKKVLSAVLICCILLGFVPAVNVMASNDAELVVKGVWR
jgi:hypothetical protein